MEALARWGWLAAMAALLTSCSGTDCTAVGCGTPIDLHFTRPLWGPGDYVVTVVADGEELTCKARFREGDCESRLPDCGRPFSPLLGACVGANSSLEGFELDRHPKKLELTVTRDGQPVVEQTLSPSYAETENGCGTCSRARVDVTTP